MDVASRLRRDGVAHIRGVVGAAQLRRLADAVEHCRAAPGPNFRTLSKAGQPAVQSDLFRWRDVAAIREVAAQGPVPRLAAEVFGSNQVILLEDQWFASDAGSSTPSPWHQDHPYHPLEPWFLTIWIPLDPAPGPVGIRAVPGSHLGDVYAPVEFSAGRSTLESGGAALPPVPEIDGNPRASVVAPQASPGDAVLLDSRTLHAAGGPCAARFRRLSIRYAAPGTRIVPRGWPVAAFWKEHDLAAGSLLAGDAFPLLNVR